MSNLNQTTSNAETSLPIKLHFDPAVEGGHPSLSVQVSSTSLEPISYLRLTAYAMDTLQYTMGEKDLHAGDSVRFYLPERGTKDYLGIKAELIVGNETTLLKEWRALYLPGQKLVDYAGSDELQQPPDFESYWREAKEKLARVPMNPEITPIPEKETQTGKLYQVKLNSYDDIPIVGWYYVPKEIDPLTPSTTKRKYPAIQIMPGWGAEEPPNDRTADGFITLCLNPRSHGPSRKYFSVEDHHLWNINSPDHYYYRAAYMDCLRGIDFLMSRTEVDTQHVGVEGGSQGGAFALAVGALDHRISCICSNVTYISNFPDFINLSTDGSGITFRQLAEDQVTGRDILKTLSYIDVSNLTGWIQCPTMVCVGLQDRICPPANGIVALNHIPKNIPKRLILDPDADHEVTPLMQKANRDWFDKYLKHNP